MKLKLIWMVLLGFLGNSLLAQRGTIKTGSESRVNIELIGGTAIDNANFIKEKKGKEIITYTPDQIKEYSFKNGATYISKEIVIDGERREKFLELVYDYNVKLFYYRDNEKYSDSNNEDNKVKEAVKLFFLEKDDSLYLISPKNYKGNLNVIMRFYTEKKITYTKKSLIFYLELAQDNLVRDNFSIEIFAGAGFSNVKNLNIDNNIRGVNLDGSPMYHFGVASNFKFNEIIDFGFGVNFKKENYTYTHPYTDITSFLLDLEFSHLQLPVYVKINPSQINKLFIKSGLYYSINLSKSINAYRITESTSGIFIDDYLVQQDIKNNYLGIFCSAGYVFELDKFGISTELVLNSGYRDSDQTFNNVISLSVAVIL